MVSEVPRGGAGDLFKLPTQQQAVLVFLVHVKMYVHFATCFYFSKDFFLLNTGFYAGLIS